MVSGFQANFIEEKAHAYFVAGKFCQGASIRA